MAQKEFKAGRLTTPKDPTPKMTIATLAYGKDDNATFTPVKLIGRSREVFKAHQLDKGAPIAMYCEVGENTYTNREGEKCTETTYTAQSLYTPVSKPEKGKDIVVGKKFFAGFIHEVKEISQNLVVLVLKIGKDEHRRFEEVKLTRASLDSFRQTSFTKGVFLGISYNESMEEYVPKSGPSAGQKVEKPVYFAKGLFQPLYMPE